ncbi:MAG: UPF0280 family protein [Proteobacteria bacterium]|nr:UPF0280 family protein [Pseudomonadota bacterium]
MEGIGERKYRNLVTAKDLVAFRVTVQETDLFVMAEKPLSRETRDAVARHRHSIEAYIGSHSQFRESLIPLQDDPLAPKIVREMLQASQQCGVGPMAGVAGAMSHFVGEDLLNHSRDVIIENGGDIYMRSSKKRRVAIYAGLSPFSLKIGLIISSKNTPVGVCTSSGTVGHSRSFGQADAVCVVSKSSTLADAAATAVGNSIMSKNDIEEGLTRARQIDGVMGVVVVVADALGVWGDIEIVRI